MAHAHALPVLPGAWTREAPNPARITAFSGVIALHVTAFVMLMLPMRVDVPAPEPREEVVFPVLRVRPPERVIPKPVPKDLPKSVPRIPTRLELPTPPQPPVVIDVGPDVAPPPGPALEPVVAPIVEPGPVDVERLEYASAPPPPYPVEAARRRIEGTVVLRVLVDVDGKPLEVLVHESSGHRALDEAARKFVLAKWRFRPAMQGDVAVQALGIVPIRFTMR